MSVVFASYYNYIINGIITSACPTSWFICHEIAEISNRRSDLIICLWTYEFPTHAQKINFIIIIHHMNESIIIIVYCKHFWLLYFPHTKLIPALSQEGSNGTFIACANNTCTIFCTFCGYIYSCVYICTCSSCCSPSIHCRQKLCIQGRVLGLVYWSKHTLHVNCSSICLRAHSAIVLLHSHTLQGQLQNACMQTVGWYGNFTTQIYCS